MPTLRAAKIRQLERRHETKNHEGLTKVSAHTKRLGDQLDAILKMLVARARSEEISFSKWILKVLWICLPGYPKYMTESVASLGGLRYEIICLVNIVPQEGV